MPAPNEFYTDALVYDVLHTPGTAGDVRALERIERRFVPRDLPRVWLEPACGSGRHLRLAARRGIHAIGFDLSEPMIDYARARGCSHAFVGDMRAFTLPRGSPRVSLAFNLINTLRHLGGDRAMLDHFACMKRALHPRGVYAVGLSLSAYGLESPSEDAWRGRRGGLSVSQLVQFIPPEPGSPAPRTERVYSHLAIQRGESTTHQDSAYTLRCYNRRQWDSLLKRAGWRVLATLDQDARDHTIVEPGYGVWVLAPGATRSGSNR
jgi:SAM-dependent methyltransferase